MQQLIFMLTVFHSMVDVCCSSVSKYCANENCTEKLFQTVMARGYQDSTESMMSYEAGDKVDIYAIELSDVRHLYEAVKLIDDSSAPIIRKKVYAAHVNSQSYENFLVQTIQSQRKLFYVVLDKTDGNIIDAHQNITTDELERLLALHRNSSAPPKLQGTPVNANIAATPTPSLHLPSPTPHVESTFSSNSNQNQHVKHASEQLAPGNIESKVNSPDATPGSVPSTNIVVTPIPSPQLNRPAPHLDDSRSSNLNENQRAKFTPEKVPGDTVTKVYPPNDPQHNEMNLNATPSPQLHLHTSHVEGSIAQNSNENHHVKHTLESASESTVAKVDPSAATQKVTTLTPSLKDVVTGDSLQIPTNHRIERSDDKQTDSVSGSSESKVDLEMVKSAAKPVDQLAEQQLSLNIGEKNIKTLQTVLDSYQNTASPQFNEKSSHLAQSENLTQNQTRLNTEKIPNVEEPTTVFLQTTENSAAPQLVKLPTSYNTHASVNDAELSVKSKELPSSKIIHSDSMITTTASPAAQIPQHLPSGEAEATPPPSVEHRAPSVPATNTNPTEIHGGSLENLHENKKLPELTMPGVVNLPEALSPPAPAHDPPSAGNDQSYKPQPAHVPDHDSAHDHKRNTLQQVIEQLELNRQPHSQDKNHQHGPIPTEELLRTTDTANGHTHGHLRETLPSAHEHSAHGHVHHSQDHNHQHHSSDGGHHGHHHHSHGSTATEKFLHVAKEGRTWAFWIRDNLKPLVTGLKAALAPMHRNVKSQECTKAILEIDRLSTELRKLRTELAQRQEHLVAGSRQQSDILRQSNEKLQSELGNCIAELNHERAKRVEAERERETSLAEAARRRAEEAEGARALRERCVELERRGKELDGLKAILTRQLPNSESKATDEKTSKDGSDGSAGWDWAEEGSENESDREMVKKAIVGDHSESKFYGSLPDLADLAQLGFELKEKAEEIDRFKLLLKDLMSEKQELELSKEKLKSENETLASSLRDTNEKSSILESKIKALKDIYEDQMKDLTKQLTKQQLDSQKQSSAAANVEEEASRLRDECAIIRKTDGELRAEIKELDGLLNKVRLELDRSRHEAWTQLRRMDREKTAVMSENVLLRQRLVAVGSGRSDLDKSPPAAARPSAGLGGADDGNNSSEAELSALARVASPATLPAMPSHPPPRYASSYDFYPS